MTGSGGPQLADACGEVPLPAVVSYAIRRLVATGYLPRFSAYLSNLGFTQEQTRAVASLNQSQLDHLVRDVGERSGWLADPVAHLAASGCTLVLAVADDAESTIGVAAPDPAATLDRYLELSVAARLLVGVDPHRPASLSRALACAEHPCFGGLALSPYSAQTPVDDDVYTAVFRAAADRGIVLWLHASAHYWPAAPIDVSHPIRIDRVLSRYPGLRLILGHAGWPWTGEACIVAVRHPQVALEFSTFSPRSLLDPGWSLTPLVANRSTLRGRIFFGSGALSDPRRYTDLVAQLDALPIGSHAAEWRGSSLIHWLEDVHGSGY